jgi:16S rRNA (guanine(966)-N(2))-methyltransferase RsmD
MALEPLVDLKVVDLFAGSGALGIEALSRGAGHVDFVEEEARALAVLRENLRALELESEAKIWRLSLPRGLKRLEAVLADADLVLLDPPYGGGRALAVLEALGKASRLRSGTRVVVEHHGRDILPASCGALAREREREYGQTRVSTYRAGESPPPVPET